MRLKETAVDKAKLPLLLFFCFFCTPIAPSQKLSPVSSLTLAPNVKVDVTLVPVHVVVRDSNGQPVGNLTKNQFQVFDRGKPQVIQQFSVDQSSNNSTGSFTADASAASARFTAYLFDDLHLEREDLNRAREAAARQIAQISSPRDRPALFTTSGRTFVDFTAGREKVREALAQLEPRGQRLAFNCPALSYYMADLIVEKGDRTATRMASDDALSCAFGGNSRSRGEAVQLALAAAREKTEVGQTETANSLGMLKAIVKAMSTAPGRRAVIIISPGFFVPRANDKEQSEISELASRSEVTISALDPRGPLPAEPNPRKSIYLTAAEIQDAAVFQALSGASGGLFFHNNNDINEGFSQVLATPQYSYTLAFAPRDLKFDGHFHQLDVKVVGAEKFSVQARKGYYAPSKKK